MQFGFLVELIISKYRATSSNERPWAAGQFCRGISEWMISPCLPKDFTTSINRESTESRCSEQPAWATTLENADCADSTVTFVNGATVRSFANVGASSPVPKSATARA